MNMQIELYIDGEKKVFTTPVVPMLARRKYFEIMAKNEEKLKEDPNYIPSYKEQLEEEDELLGVLANVIFNGQFTVEQLYNGADYEYVYSKLREAVFGKQMEADKGNEQGK
jgi:hypothetical protein